jgi:DNA-directed RNA polymerase specialized sigma24 family protein
MDEHALVAAARADPRRGFGVLYQRYADRIHDYCLAVLRHREDAADAAQDTFLSRTSGWGSCATRAG